MITLQGKTLGFIEVNGARNHQGGKDQLFSCLRRDHKTGGGAIGGVLNNSETHRGTEVVGGVNLRHKMPDPIQTKALVKHICQQIQYRSNEDKAGNHGRAGLINRRHFRRNCGQGQNGTCKNAGMQNDLEGVTLKRSLCTK